MQLVGGGRETIILHVSDVHCHTRALAKIAGEAGAYDLVVFSGDAECIDAAEALLRLPCDVVAVTGNLDNASIYRLLRDAGALADGRVLEVLGFKIAGVGGLDPATNIERLETSLSEGLRPDIMISHHPPRGILDRTLIGVSGGLESIARLTRQLKPGLHAFGHIHESPGTQHSGRTLFVNPGPAYEGRYALIRYESGVFRGELRRARNT